MVPNISNIRLALFVIIIICFTSIAVIIFLIGSDELVPGISVKSLTTPGREETTLVATAKETLNITVVARDKLTSKSPRLHSTQDSHANLQIELGKRLAEASKKKTILVWYKTGMGGPGGPVGRQNCGNCWVSKDRSLISDNSTAAVVFYYYEISPQTMPPSSSRRPDQMYVFWNKEPTPLMRYVHKHELDFEETIHFNATMTYRRDSDFYNTYRYHWIDAAFTENMSLQSILKLKQNTSVVLVSDCNWTAGARMRMKLLNKIKSLGFKIDTFGKCFPDSPAPSKGQKDTIKLIRKYKFHFAFENSYRCTDYITEKFYRNSLFAGAVPVVFGSKRRDYENVAPPGSFIFLEDFKTLEDLVDYLNYLDNNDTAYLEYHRWRTTNPEISSPGNERVHPFCQLCRTLYGINVDDMYNPRYSDKPIPTFTDTYLYRRSVPSLKEYLFVNEDKLCLEKNETLLPPYYRYDLT